MQGESASKGKEAYMQELPGYEKGIMAGRMHGLRMFPECENESRRRTMPKGQMVMIMLMT